MCSSCLCDAIGLFCSLIVFSGQNIDSETVQPPMLSLSLYISRHLFCPSSSTPSPPLGVYVEPWASCMLSRSSTTELYLQLYLLLNCLIIVCFVHVFFYLHEDNSQCSALEDGLFCLTACMKINHLKGCPLQCLHTECLLCHSV